MFGFASHTERLPGDEPSANGKATGTGTGAGGGAGEGGEEAGGLQERVLFKVPKERKSALGTRSMLCPTFFLPSLLLPGSAASTLRSSPCFTLCFPMCFPM